MHLDALLARRTQAGAPVVHGVHALLWSLEKLADRGLLERPVVRLDVRFSNFIYVGNAATLRIVPRPDGALRAEVLSAGVTAATLDIVFAPATGACEPAVATATLDGASSPEFAAVIERAGSVSLDGRVAPLFPALALRIGATRVETLGRLSYVVGMECPGLHSIFSTLALSFVESANGAASALQFHVSGLDERVRFVEIAVAAPGVRGIAGAFMRQPPVAQRSFSEARRLVAPSEFTGTTALVVGGSRGLGAVTARLLAAGGARVVLSYAVGEADARDVVTEIGGERCRAIHYDVREAPGPQLEPSGWPINQLYYFPSAHIHRQKAELFAPERLIEFLEVYARGFERTVGALRQSGASELRGFYPSSIAVEDRPRGMTEYAMAKAAGEILCADMNRFLPKFRVLVRRLPRVLTDQTATIMPVESSDALEVMLPIVREMHDALG